MCKYRGWVWDECQFCVVSPFLEHGYVSDERFFYMLSYSICALNDAVYKYQSSSPSESLCQRQPGHVNEIS